jgi:hypothetical protein
LVPIEFTLEPDGSGQISMVVKKNNVEIFNREYSDSLTNVYFNYGDSVEIIINLGTSGRGSLFINDILKSATSTGPLIDTFIITEATTIKGRARFDVPSLVEIGLGYSPNSPQQACDNWVTPISKYIYDDFLFLYSSAYETAVLANALELYDDDQGLTLSPGGYYSNGIYYRTWSGTVFSGPLQTLCPAPVSPLEFSSEFDNVIGEDGVDTGTSVQWNYSGTITIATGYTYTFKTYAGNYGDPNGTVSSSATIDGTTMNAYNPFGDGTVLSTNSKTLTAGTYNYSLAITISSIGDLGGGISWT